MVQKFERTVSLAFDHEDYNEEPIAREMAAHTGASLQIVPIRQSELAENFSDAIWHCETISSGANTAAKYLLSRAARDAGYKVVLTGEGSDEIFGGYAPFRQDMLLYNNEGQDEQTVQRLLEELKLNNPVSAGLFSEDTSNPLTSVKRTLGFVPSWIKSLSALYFQYFSLYSSEFISEFKRRDAHRIFLNQIDVRGQLEERSPVHQSLYLWSKTILANYLLRRLGDGVEMAHSIEGRLPFLDHYLVELVRNIPVSLKIRGLTEKYVLREAARPFVTDRVSHRQKHSFTAPPSTFKLNEALYQPILCVFNFSTSL